MTDEKFTNEQFNKIVALFAEHGKLLFKQQEQIGQLSEQLERQTNMLDTLITELERQKAVLDAVMTRTRGTSH